MNCDENPNNTRLIVFAVETSGALGKSARSFLEELSKAEKDENGGTPYDELE